MKQLFSKAANLVGKLGDAAPGMVAGRPAHAGHEQQRGSSAGAGVRHDAVLEHLLRDFRSATLRRHFFANPSDAYTDSHEITLLAGTYNVAGKKPPPGLLLTEWLDQWRDAWPRSSSSSNSNAAGGADIVAVGFQEVVPLSAGNVIAGPSSAGADAWDYALAATLNGADWAGRNFGRTFGSAASSQAMYANVERLGSQAAYAYSLISSQAASVVGAMEQVWSGGDAPPNGSADGAGSSGQPGAEQQAARLQQALESKDDGEDVYVQVACKQLVGVYLSVWVRKRLARHVRGVQAAAAATGWGGYLGNKGAVAVRLRVYDAPLVLVCAHLASGDAEGDELRRNADVADILRRCTFGAGADGSAAELPGGGGHWGSASAIADHANVVWLGDLNYRLVCGDEEARRCIRAGQLQALLRHDQLGREVAAGRVFVGWREGPVGFSPTYKYHLGCNVYSGEALPPGVRAVDSSASLADSAGDAPGEADPSAAGAAARDSPSVEKQKKRTPAWCDRVLWLHGGQLHQLAYGRGELAVSDHRPVAAAFLLEAHRYRRDDVQQLAEAARRAADMSDNAARPRCSLAPNFLELGQVPFGSPVSCAVTLANTGGAPARFYFVPPPKAHTSSDGQVAWDDNQPLAPPWLAISPAEGEVAPGASATITLTALVTGGGPASAAAHLAAHPAPPPAPPHTLDTILILRLEDGADSFISCHGSFLPSCYGMELDALLGLGASPVLAVEALDEQGRALLQQGLAPPAAQQQAQQQVAAVGDLLGDVALASEPGAGGRGSSGGGGGGSGGGSSSSSGNGGRPATGLEARVPKEVQRLVSFLWAQQRLHTPGLFVDSIRACLGTSSSSTGGGGSSAGGAGRGQLRSSAALQQLLAATAPVRWSLDTGLDMPQHVTPHQAAAALLLLFQQLPDSFIPGDVSALLLHCVPPAPACASLLSDALSVAEWATLRHVLALLRGALSPPAAAANGLAAPALAGALAECWFGGSVAVLPELHANRVAFLMTLLDPDGATDAAAAAVGVQHTTMQRAPAAATAAVEEESLI